MKFETIHKELPDLSSNEALREMFNVAMDIVTRNGKQKITDESLPLLFLLGAMLPANTILAQIDDSKKLKEIELMVESACDALKAQGCYVTIQDEEGFLANPPDDMSDEEKTILARKILTKLVNRVCKNMPEQLKGTMEDELLARMKPENSTVN